MLRYYDVVTKVRLVLISCIGLLFLEGTPTQIVYVLLVNIASAVLVLKTQVSVGSSIKLELSYAPYPKLPLCHLQSCFEYALWGLL
jgi:hypothetical protein